MFGYRGKMLSHQGGACGSQHAPLKRLWRKQEGTLEGFVQMALIEEADLLRHRNHTVSLSRAFLAYSRRIRFK